MLTINMLGKGVILYDKECISEKLSSKLVALICLLVLNKNRNMSKEKIISYLWPDSDDEAAKSNLRFNLWNIKKSIPQSGDGEDFILSGKDFCRINEKYLFSCDKIRLDNCKVSQIEDIEDLITLKNLFVGDFLEGLYLRNCNDFNEMILFERVVCQNKQIEILEKLIGLYDEQERFEEELQILNEAASIEPYNEHFAYQAIRVYGKLGNRTAAINYYKNFEIILRRNLNTSPNNELKLLYKELLESTGNMRLEQRSREKAPRRRLDLVIHGMRDIEYSGLAEMTDQIFRKAEQKCLLELDQPYLADLSSIYSGFRLDYEKLAPGFADGNGTVPTVRVAFAFLRLIEHVALHYELHIQIGDQEELDPVSRNVLQYLERIKSDHIIVNNG